MREEVRRQPLGCAAAKSVRMPRSAWLRREASKFFLAHGLQPGGPEDKQVARRAPQLQPQSSTYASRRTLLEAKWAVASDGRVCPTDTPFSCKR